MKRQWMIAFVSAILMIVLWVNGACAVGSDYVITRYETTAPGAEAPLKLVLIADMHGSDIADALTRDIAAEAPDLILLGGDMFNSTDDDLSALTELCAALTEIAPVYACEGNHEYGSKVGEKKVRKAYEKGGARYLVNETETVMIGETAVQLVGIRGISVSQWEKKGGREMMRSLEDRYDGVRVVLAHVPALFKSGMENYEFDLAVSGHVQGGVLQIPGIGGLWSKEEGLFPEFSGGSYALDHGKTLVVSRGLGASEPEYELVRKLGTSAELVVIEIAPGNTRDRVYCRVTNTKGKVNVRSGPSTQTDILRSVEPGQVLIQTGEEENGWLPVRVRGTDGYISVKFAEADPES